MLIKLALVFIICSNGLLSKLLICYSNNNQPCYSADTPVNDPLCSFFTTVFKHKEYFHIFHEGCRNKARILQTNFIKSYSPHTFSQMSMYPWLMSTLQWVSRCWVGKFLLAGPVIGISHEPRSIPLALHQHLHSNSSQLFIPNFILPCPAIPSLI